MPKILLTNPQIVTSSFNAPIGFPDDTLIRHSLAFLSASLKKAGHDVCLADLRTLKGWSEYEARIERENPDFLGVTMHTCEWEPAFESLKRAKKVRPNIATVLGGIHPTMFPEECLESGVVDFVLMGEGEISLPKLVENPGSFSPSFWGETPNLDEIPFEDREIWPDYRQRIQYPLFVTGKDPFLPPMVEVLTKRGCPWECGFCCGPGEQNLFTKETNGKRSFSLRSRSVGNVMEELLFLYDRYQFRSIVFHDDQFVINVKWVEEFCQAMHDSGLVKKGVTWWSASRPDVICKNEELFGKMKEAGAKMLSIGFESFSDRMLKWMKKGATAEENYKASEICKKLGLQIYANVMLGLPYSDGKWYPEDDQESVRAMEEIKPDINSVSFYTPMPGSWLAEWAVDKGLVMNYEAKNLGVRFPTSARIKGVDYEYLNTIIPQGFKFRSKVKNIVKKLGLYKLTVNSIFLLRKLQGVFGHKR